MASNPYASDAGFDPYTDGDGLSRPERTSLLAVFSLLCAIPCCIPGAGVLAAALGGVSLGVIRNARGRLSGRPAAIAAIFIGIFITVVQAALVIGALQSYTFWTNTMAPAAERFVLAAASGDTSLARAALTNDASNDLTDDRLAAFNAAVAAEIGAPTAVAADVEDLFDAFTRVYGSSGGAYRGQQAGPGLSSTTPAPFVITGPGGTLLCWVLFDSDSLDNPPPRVADILVALPDERGFTLRDAGPAADLAAAMNITIEPLEDISDPPAPDAPEP